MGEKGGGGIRKRSKPGGSVHLTPKSTSWGKEERGIRYRIFLGKKIGQGGGRNAETEIAGGESGEKTTSRGTNTEERAGEVVHLLPVMGKSR